MIAATAGAAREDSSEVLGAASSSDNSVMIQGREFPALVGSQAAGRAQSGSGAGSGSSGVNVKVIVRCRPLSTNERKDVSQFQVVTSRVEAKEILVSQTIPGRKIDSYSKAFTFDAVCNQYTTQAELFQLYIQPIVDEVLQGFNCTIFAYGQTGTGKTYTMEGDIYARIQQLRSALGGGEPAAGATTRSLAKDAARDSARTTAAAVPSTSSESLLGALPLGAVGSRVSSAPTPGPVTIGAQAGIIPRAVEHIFERLEAHDTEYSVRVSYLEIYNEELNDLLNDGEKQSLRIFDDPNSKKGLSVDRLEEMPVNNPQDIFNILCLAVKKRRTAETLLNRQSSRSHCIFSVTIHMKETNIDGEDVIKIGKLNLVDLAGSENIQRSGANSVKDRAKEAGMINQSLLTLGRVINSLVEHSSYIPYRDSKLTRLLQESLGGRTKTCIIATISPSSLCLEETLSTLDYAFRAKNIRNRPEVNQKMSKRVMIRELNQEIERLKVELQSNRERNGVYLPLERYMELETRLRSQSNELTDASSEIGRLKVHVDAAAVELAKSRATHDQEVAQHESTKQQLADVNEQLNSCRHRVGQLEVEAELQQSSIESLRTERLSLSEQLRKSESAVAEVMAQLSRCRSVLQHNFEVSRTSLDCATQEFERIRATLVPSLRQRSEDLRNAVAVYKIRMETSTTGDIASLTSGAIEPVLATFTEIAALAASDMQEAVKQIGNNHSIISKLQGRLHEMLLSHNELAHRAGDTISHTVSGLASSLGAALAATSDTVARRIQEQGELQRRLQNEQAVAIEAVKAESSALATTIQKDLQDLHSQHATRAKFLHNLEETEKRRSTDALNQVQQAITKLFADIMDGGSKGCSAAFEAIRQHDAGCLEVAVGSLDRIGAQVDGPLSHSLEAMRHATATSSSSIEARLADDRGALNRALDVAQGVLGDSVRSLDGAAQQLQRQHATSLDELSTICLEPLIQVRDHQASAIDGLGGKVDGTFERLALQGKCRVEQLSVDLAAHRDASARLLSELVAEAERCAVAVDTSLTETSFCAQAAGGKTQVAHLDLQHWSPASTPVSSQRSCPPAMSSGGSVDLSSLKPAGALVQLGSAAFSDASGGGFQTPMEGGSLCCGITTPAESDRAEPMPLAAPSPAGSNGGSGARVSSSKTAETTSVGGVPQCPGTAAGSVSMGSDEMKKASLASTSQGLAGSNSTQRSLDSAITMSRPNMIMPKGTVAATPCLAAYDLLLETVVSGGRAAAKTVSEARSGAWQSSSAAAALASRGGVVSNCPSSPASRSEGGRLDCRGLRMQSRSNAPSAYKLSLHSSLERRPSDSSTPSLLVMSSRRASATSSFAAHTSRHASSSENMVFPSATRTNNPKQAPGQVTRAQEHVASDPTSSAAGRSTDPAKKPHMQPTTLDATVAWAPLRSSTSSASDTPSENRRPDCTARDGGTAARSFQRAGGVNTPPRARATCALGRSIHSRSVGGACVNSIPVRQKQQLIQPQQQTQHRLASRDIALPAATTARCGAASAGQSNKNSMNRGHRSNSSRSNTSSRSSRSSNDTSAVSGSTRRGWFGSRRASQPSDCPGLRPDYEGDENALMANSNHEGRVKEQICGREDSSAAESAEGLRPLPDHYTSPRPKKSKSPSSALSSADSGVSAIFGRDNPYGFYHLPARQYREP